MISGITSYSRCLLPHPLYLIGPELIKTFFFFDEELLSPDNATFDNYTGTFEPLARTGFE